MNTSIAVKSLLGVVALALPLVASAESNVSAGAAVIAHVDFQVNIPKILYLRVGTGSSYSTGSLIAGPAIDLITFSPAASTVGTGTVINGVGGDLTGGVETAAVISTVGSATLTATEAAAGLIDGVAGDPAIPFTQITITQPTAPITTGYTTLLAPVFNATGGSTPVPLTASNKVVTADGQWKFSYANSVTVPGGTYGGANVNNGRVTYTLTSP